MSARLFLRWTSVSLRAKRWITAEELERLADHIHPRYRAAVLLMGYMGLRRGEMAGLQRADIDLKKKTLSVQGLGDTVTTSVVLDGEIVCLDEDNKPDFAALWFRSRGASTPPVCYVIFDLLHVGERELIDEPYRERRRILEDLELSGPHWCTPGIHVGEGAALFDATKEMGLEGVVAKRLDSRYRPGLRSKSWTKTKHFQTRNFALLGWLPPEEWRQDRGCVVLGLRSEAGIAMAGVLESGYGRDLVGQLPQLSRADYHRLSMAGAFCPGSEPMVAQVKYLEWSPAGGFRLATMVASSVGQATGAAD